jgi:phytoene dehydrogenase-like protein
MPSSSYDLIVLGDDFSGLVTATLAVRRGLRVLLLASGRDVASYQLGSYRLPAKPLALAGWDLGATRRVIDELH